MLTDVAILIIGSRLPLQNKAGVQRQPVSFEYKQANAFVPLTFAVEYTFSAQPRQQLQGEWDFSAVRDERIEFQPQHQVVGRHELALEADDSPARRGAFRSQDSSAASPDCLEQFSFDDVPSECRCLINPRVQGNAQHDTGR